MLTHEELKRQLSYNPDTGLFTWLIRKNQNVPVGHIAGTTSAKGYINIWINQESYRANRLAVFYMTGVWPTKLVDHIDGVRDNNKWDNLQELDNSANMLKAKVYTSNTTGYKGISRQDGKFRVRKTINGKRISLGLFKTLAEAKGACGI